MFTFDFNENPVRLYGIWPETPFPVEVSIYGTCSNQCFYCFANLNRVAADRKPHEKNPIEKVISGIEKALADPKDPIGYFLRNKYPICFSNTTDPFMREEKKYRATEAFLKYAKKRGFPLWIQTKGGVLLEEFDRYAPLIVQGKDAVYMTLTTLDDEISRRIEPGAPLSSERLELMRKLSARGIPVVVACNPYLDEWAGAPSEYCKAVKDAGARGIWLEQLHFTNKQSEQIPAAFRDYIRKANTFPMFHVKALKEWYKATAAEGLDFFPSPYWDAYFGEKAKYPECAAPEWFGEGSRLFTVGFDFIRRIHELSTGGESLYTDDLEVRKGAKKVIFSWPAVERFLAERNIKNPMLKTSPFWGPYNAKQVADHRQFKATLGSEAPLYEILRYFFNHPEDSQNFLWYAPMAQILTDFDTDTYVTNSKDDRIFVYDPSCRHHGGRDHDFTTYQHKKDEYIHI